MKWNIESEQKKSDIILTLLQTSLFSFECENKHFCTVLNFFLFQNFTTWYEPKVDMNLAFIGWNAETEIHIC